MTDDALAPTPADRSRYGSRKWLLALLVVLGSSALLLVGKIDMQTWAEVVIPVVGLYMAGNAGTAWAAAFTGRRS